MKKIESLMSINFDSKPTYGDDGKYIKAKIKKYEYSITRNFRNQKGSEKITEEKAPFKCLSIIILDSTLYAYEKYHPQTFLEECKYAQEKIKTKNFIYKESKSESDIDTDVDTDNDE